MKKFLLSMAVALTAMFATAQTKTYTDELVVTINGTVSDPMQTTINVEPKTDGTYTLSLLNFIMVSGEDAIPVGNIVVPGISYQTVNGIDNFASKQDIVITEGSIEAEEWLGPMLGDVPVDMTGKMTEYKLYCNIDIDMTAMLGQTINVKFGQEDLAGIEGITIENGADVIYDITGRRIETITAAGIYLVNGKKALVK